MSSPPRCVLPLVASTWKTPLSNSRIEMSKVPPPRSKTAIFDFASELIEAVGERGSGRLVDDALDRESGRFAGALWWRCVGRR